MERNTVIVFQGNVYIKDDAVFVGLDRLSYIKEELDHTINIFCGYGGKIRITIEADD